MSLPTFSHARPTIEFNFFDTSPTGVEEVKLKQNTYEPFGAILRLMTDNRSAIFFSGGAGTGKTRGILEKIFLIAENTPNAQIAICRKKRVDLTNSALLTWEKFVLPKGHPAARGATRAHREVYRFPNGSEVHAIGLQDTSGRGSSDAGPQKLTSTEWDIIYINEVNECDYADFILATTRLRGNARKNRQLLADFNPVINTHWIYQARAKNELDIEYTVHQDNPRWWVLDENGKEEHPITGQKGRWTEDGEVYVNGILANLQGNARKRFFLGEPITPDEVIYKEFDPEKHCNKYSLLEQLSEKVKSGEKTREEVEDWLYKTFSFIQGNDWGYEHPASFELFALDKNNHLRRICEFFRSETLTEDAAKEWITYLGWEKEEDGCIRKLEEPELGYSVPIFYKANGNTYFQNVDVVTDHDPEKRLKFEEGSGLSTELAIKSVDLGIEACRTRLNKCTVSFDPVIPIGGYDPNLKAKMRPLCLIEEFIMYKNKVTPSMGLTNNPVKKNDDGMDSFRYVVASVDQVPEDNKLDYKKVAQTTSIDPEVIFSTFRVVGSNEDRKMW